MFKNNTSEGLGKQDKAKKEIEVQCNFNKGLPIFRQLGCSFKIVQSWGKGSGTRYPCNNLQAALDGACPWIRRFSSAEGNSFREQIGQEQYTANMANSWGMSVVLKGKIQQCSQSCYCSLCFVPLRSTCFV